MIARLLLLVALLTGCGPECGSKHDLSGNTVDGNMCDERVQGTITLSSMFESDDIEALWQGSKMWSDATGGRVRIKWVITDDDPTARWLTSDHADWLGDKTPDGHLEFNPSLHGSPLFATVAAHELGHWFGLGHSKDTAALMFPIVLQPYASIPAQDVAKFNELWSEM